VHSNVHRNDTTRDIVKRDITSRELHRETSREQLVAKRETWNEARESKCVGVAWAPTMDGWAVREWAGFVGK
jgi:hypothetical protein